MSGNETNPATPGEVDVLILGGGVTGISLAALLGRCGKSVVLLEKGDFASGTSQASGMMIWGGLLYLRNLEFGLVRRFCRARDRLIRGLSSEISPRRFTYLSLRTGGRKRLSVWLALQLYQVLAFWKRGAVRPFLMDRLDPVFDRTLFKRGWTYEEGFLAGSDARFALQRLRSAGPGVEPRNYCEATEIERSAATGKYRVGFRDMLSGETGTIHAGKIVNCGGVWAEEINELFHISTRHTHHLSKGVYLLLPGRENDEALVVDMENQGDTLCWVPWGEVIMWGPTETTISRMDEAIVDAADVDFLLGKLNRFSTTRWSREEIINVRCGVRPLAKTKGQKVGYPLDLSRRGIIEKAPDQPWWTVFGGKFSGAADFAEEIYSTLYGGKACPVPDVPVSEAPPATRAFFGGRSLPDPAYCRDFEFCRRLEDYMRRRTNLAQWIPRGGFGRDFEFEADVLAIAEILTKSAVEGERELLHYKNVVLREWKRWHE